MNTLPGHITALKKEGKLTIVHVKVKDAVFTSIIINENDQEDQLTIDQPVEVMFKETEVIIGVGADLQVSLRNQLPGVIADIERSDLLCKLSIDSTGGVVRSLITRNAADALNLTEGKEVVAMIKTNEILLST